jgi:hypothetical protein
MAPGNILRAGFAAEKSSQTLRRGLTHERFETQPNSFGIGRGAARFLGVFEEFIIDIQCLLHT